MRRKATARWTENVAASFVLGAPETKRVNVEREIEIEFHDDPRALDVEALRNKIEQMMREGRCCHCHFCQAKAVIDILRAEGLIP